MNTTSKIALTVFIWLTTLGAFIPTLAIGLPTIGAAIIPIVVFLFGACIMMNGFIWQWGQQDKGMEVQAEKRKRERLDTVLRGMSSDDLMALKRRIMDGDFDEGELVDDEGELLIGGRKR
jgi:hypothetical protein